MDTAQAEPAIPPRSKPFRISPPKRSKGKLSRSSRTLDRDLAIEQARRGLKTTEIAKLQGVAPSTVWRFLDDVDASREQIERFKSNRADVLASLHGETVSLQKKVLESLAQDGILTALTPPQKSNLLFALNATAGTTYDKERLERGESTQNISTVSRMIDSRVGSLYTRKPLTDQHSPDSQESGS